MIKITWLGNPVTKKNSMRMITNPKTGKPMPIPSAAYKRYEKDCIAQTTGNMKKKLELPCNVKCLYYMDTRRKVDLTNLLSATHDILVKAGILADDNSSIVYAVDGSRVGYDKANPRVEIEITEA